MPCPSACYNSPHSAPYRPCCCLRKFFRLTLDCVPDCLVDLHAETPLVQGTGGVQVWDLGISWKQKGTPSKLPFGGLCHGLFWVGRLWICETEANLRSSLDTFMAPSKYNPTLPPPFQYGPGLWICILPPPPPPKRMAIFQPFGAVRYPQKARGVAEILGPEVVGSNPRFYTDGCQHAQPCASGAE